MPLHVWLPGAHAAAPSHVSAILSGVFIKMGVYGLVRVTSLLPNPPVAWTAVVLALGAVSGVLGVAYAVGQRDPPAPLDTIPEPDGRGRPRGIAGSCFARPAAAL